MRLRNIFLTIILSLFLIIIMNNNVSCDVLYSDWVGTLDKSYELAWQQSNGQSYNNHRTDFFLEYTYLMSNSVKYPTYCIEYYLKGPRGNDQYGKEKLVNTDMQDKVKNGLMQIIKNGYPNVLYPYGTTDVSEAYYATSAAVHIWTMYYGVDNVAGSDIGWFQYKDGFVMNKANLLKYISDGSTASTASGWHVIGPNNNAASRRTWVAAMHLLIDALEADMEKPYVTLQKNAEPYLSDNEIIFEYKIQTNLCTDLKVKIEPEIKGIKTEYTNNTQNECIVKIKLPINAVNTGDKYNIFAYGNLKGANDINNYYYLYHLTGTYQTMVYLNSSANRSINSSKSVFEIPKLTSKIYYDLNYSGLNYVRGGDFNNLGILSYQGKKSISTKGNVTANTIDYSYGLPDKVYNVYYGSNPGKDNCVLINTLLNSGTDYGFVKSGKRYLTFSCWIRTRVPTSIKFSFENSSTIYEEKISKANEWQHVVFRISKSDYESNALCIYPDTETNVWFYKMQLEDGNSFTDYCSENAANAEPAYTEHQVGSKYSNLYNGSEPQRESYVFLGWNTKKNGTGSYVNENDVVGIGNQILYAIWTTKDTYKVYLHYSANGGELLEKGDSISYNGYGYEVFEVPNGTEFKIEAEGYRSNWKFLGWSYEDDLKDDVFDDIENKMIDTVFVNNSDIHLYANYKKIHRIQYHYYDEKSDSEQILYSTEKASYNNYPYSGSAILPKSSNSDAIITVPELDDYSLKGWSVVPYELDEITYKPGETVNFTDYEHFYAVYEKNITVEFYDNNENGNNMVKHDDESFLHKKYDLDVNRNCRGDISYASFTLPKYVCKVNGYKFYGWSDSQQFNGSIIFYASESGTEVKIDKSQKFYALYSKTYIVKFHDYDFEKNTRHIEKELSAYEYMNYRGETNSAEIIVPYYCNNDIGWEFNGWTLSNNCYAEYKVMPGQILEISKDMSYYAVYKSNIKINCHYLINEGDSVIRSMDTIVIDARMNSLGAKYNTEAVLPDISSFSDNQSWVGIGYTNVSDADAQVVYEQDEKYSFDKNTDLYAIYDSGIRIDFYDYSYDDNKEIVTNIYKFIKRTCDKSIKGVKIVFPESVSATGYEQFGWAESSSYNDEIKYFPGDELEVNSNDSFYAIYTNTYTLKCNDLLNNQIRSRFFNTEENKYYNGKSITNEIKIPEQGNNNSLKPTNNWNLSHGIEADYLSGDIITIAADTELNAIYSADVKVTYDANGGTFTDGSTEKETVGTCYHNILGDFQVASFIPDLIPERRGYKFCNKWNDDISGTGNEFKYGEAFQSDKDIRLYAVWKEVKEPYLASIDRYYFVGEKINYDDVVSKIIAFNEYGESDIENVKITSVNDKNTLKCSKKDIESLLISDRPRTYIINIKYDCSGSSLKDTFNIFIVARNDNPNRLRYISSDCFDSIDTESKWSYGSLKEKLTISLNKSKDKAKWIYNIEGKELKNK